MLTYRFNGRLNYYRSIEIIKIYFLLLLFFRLRQMECNLSTK